MWGYGAGEAEAREPERLDFCCVAGAGYAKPTGTMGCAEVPAGESAPRVGKQGFEGEKSLLLVVINSINSSNLVDSGVLQNVEVEEEGHRNEQDIGGYLHVQIFEFYICSNL